MAHDGVGCGVVGCGGISAIDRRLPLLAPEVLVSGVDAPRGRQLDAGICCTDSARSDRTTVRRVIDAVAADTDAVGTAVEQRVHVGIREVDVLPGAFGVVAVSYTHLTLPTKRIV